MVMGSSTGTVSTCEVGGLRDHIGGPTGRDMEPFFTKRQAIRIQRRLDGQFPGRRTILMPISPLHRRSITHALLSTLSTNIRFINVHPLNDIGFKIAGLAGTMGDAAGMILHGFMVRLRTTVRGEEGRAIVRVDH